jgi:hypothetical protein
MLARTQEAIRTTRNDQTAQEIGALQRALRGFFDYAGLFPPAELALPDALARYRRYAAGQHADSLACFVVGFSHLADLAAVHPAAAPVPLSITGAFDAPWHTLQGFLRAGLRIQMIEVKVASPQQVKTIQQELASSITAYYEVSFDALSTDLLAAISHTGGRVKLRMGGTTAEAFPDPLTIAEALHMLATYKLPFKATAGLHHPLRSLRPFTYQEDSPHGRMHGFVNLLCAAALVHFGGTARDGQNILTEEDPKAFKVTQNYIQWHNHRWSTAQLRDVRRSFLIRIGSCSFTEPMNELEALGWL